MAYKNAAERLTERIQGLLERERLQKRPKGLRKTQVGLSKAIGVQPPTVSQTLAGRHDAAFRLVQLDNIADYFGVTPASLIQYDTSAMMELTPAEKRWLQHWREWPPDVQRQVLELLEFFATAILPEERQERVWWTRMRRLSPDDRSSLARYLDALLEKQASARRQARGEIDAGQVASDKLEAPPTRKRKRRRP